MDRGNLIELLKSIYGGCWLSVDYKNAEGKTTRYWADIKDIMPTGKMLIDGFKTDGSNQFAELTIYFESIVSCSAVEETFHEIHRELIDKINDNQFPFLDAPIENSGVLEYFEQCMRFDTQPYQTHYKMIDGIDGAVLSDITFALSDEQFRQAVSKCRFKTSDTKKGTYDRELCLNVLSIRTKKGLYVLAYKPLKIDVKNHRLIPAEEPIINYQFVLIHGEAKEVCNISQFLSEEDQSLLDDFVTNQQVIENKITERARMRGKVDDSPYIIFLERRLSVDLHSQYEPIYNAIESGDKSLISTPIRVFTGELAKTDRRKAKPIILYDDSRINLDQLLVINKSTKNDITYVQGPPGTGKTNTILSVVLSAFFNDQSCLVVSYNNHPVDAIYESLSNIPATNCDHVIPLPIIRLGSYDRLLDSMKTIRELYDYCKDKTPFDEYLERSKERRTNNVKNLSTLLDQYEQLLELQEGEKTLNDIVSRFSGEYLSFTTDIQVNQLVKTRQKIAEIGEITTEKAQQFIDHDVKGIRMFLYYKATKCIKRLQSDAYAGLIDIVNMPEDTDEAKKKKISDFSKYLSDSPSLALFIKAFPIICTTNISSSHLGEPFPFFDLTVMDEASQCDTATSLLPIIRGKRLLLVGDPQQLNPVIVMDPRVNNALMTKYKVNDRYDFIKKSIYKSCLETDPISDDVLLSYHYRCSPSIIGFNNKKFYNSKLKIKSVAHDPVPLKFIDTKGSKTEEKNTSLAEAQEVLKYITDHPKENIGVITPFTAQKEFLINYLMDKGISNPDYVGTVHAFQGDEKDTILFSTGITEDTQKKTYDWLEQNNELINVATSRAKSKLVVLGNADQIEKLHSGEEKDSFYELCQYVRKNGDSEVTNNSDPNSRALGYKPYSSKTEDEFMETLGQALDVVTHQKCILRTKVGIKDVFEKTDVELNEFFTGHFDFIVYKKDAYHREQPCFAFELNGDEHYTDPAVMKRDQRKAEIAKSHHFTLINVKNSYSRRYLFIKSILEEYLKEQR